MARYDTLDFPGDTYIDGKPLHSEGTNMLARQKWQVQTIKVLEEVFAERERQVKRYGHNEHLEDGTGPDVRWARSDYNAVEQEADFRRDYLAHEDQTGDPTWMHLIREEVAEAFKENDPERLQEELIQVAALCVSWVEKIQNRETFSKD